LPENNILNPDFSFAIGTLVFIISLANGISDIMITNSTGMYSGQISGDNIPNLDKPEPKRF